MNYTGKLTVTVLDTSPLVAKLGTRDLTSIDSLSGGIGSAPILESTSFRVIETPGPAGVL